MKGSLQQRGVPAGRSLRGLQILRVPSKTPMSSRTYTRDTFVDFMTPRPGIVAFARSEGQNIYTEQTDSTTVNLTW